MKNQKPNSRSRSKDGQNVQNRSERHDKIKAAPKFERKTGIYYRCIGPALPLMWILPHPLNPPGTGGAFAFQGLLNFNHTDQVQPNPNSVSPLFCHRFGFYFVHSVRLFIQEQEPLAPSFRGKPLAGLTLTLVLTLSAFIVFYPVILSVF